MVAYGYHNSSLGTQYNRNTSTTPPVNDIPVSLSSNEFLGVGLEDKDYFCSACQRKIHVLDPESKTGEYICTECNIFYFPEHEEVWSRSKISTPLGYNSNDRDVGVAYHPDVMIGKQPPTLKGAFAALAKKETLKITSYEERKG